MRKILYKTQIKYFSINSKVSQNKDKNLIINISIAFIQLGINMELKAGISMHISMDMVMVMVGLDQLRCKENGNPIQKLFL